MKLPASHTFASLLIPFSLGLFLVGTTGFDLLPTLGVLNGKRVLECVLILVLLLTTVLSPRLRGYFAQLLPALPQWAVYALLLAMAAGLASALRFVHPGYSLLEIAMPVLLVLCLFATAAARLSLANYFDRLAMLVICTVGLIAVLTEFMGFIASWAMGSEFSYTTMLVRFFHPRFYNHLQTFSIPLLAAMPFLFGASRKLKIIAIVLIGLQWCLVLVSGGRGSVVSLMAAFTLAALLFPGHRRHWLALHAAGLVLGVVMFFSIMGINQSVSPEGGQLVSQSIGRPLAHTTGRTHLWRLGWEQATEHPWLGSGPARYSCDLDPKAAAHPHSFPVTVLAEWGFPAFLLIMAVCAWLGWRLVFGCRRNQEGSEESDVLVAMLGCSIIAAAVHALVSGVLIMPASQVMTILVGGWALGRLNLQPRTPPASPAIAMTTLAAGILIAVSVCVFSFTELKQIDLRVGDIEKNALQEPRFWQSGHSCKYTYNTP